MLFEAEVGVLSIVCSKYRAECDLEHTQQDRNRLSSELRQRERDLTQTQLREKQLSRNNKIVMGKLKTEKDEVSLVTRSCFPLNDLCVHFASEVFVLKFIREKSFSSY